MTLDYVRSACKKVNLKTQCYGGNLWIFGASGLLRSFVIHNLGNPEIPAAVNATDFAKWWQFMGFDK